MTVSTLSGELKNTPRDASLVPCSVNGGLNREETLSDHRRVLTDNFGEENLLPWCWERRDLRVPVIKTPPEVGLHQSLSPQKGLCGQIPDLNSSPQHGGGFP